MYFHIFSNYFKFAKCYPDLLNLKFTLLLFPRYEIINVVIYKFPYQLNVMY